MTNESYKKTFENAQRELEMIPKVRAFLDQREAQLQKIVEGLEPIIAAEESVPALDGAFLMNPEEFFDMIREGYEPGLQESIKAVLASRAGMRLSPTSIRDHLQAGGFDTTNYRNAMATVHRALKRLDADPDSHVEAFVAPDGRTLYGWKGTKRQTRHAKEAAAPTLRTRKEIREAAEKAAADPTPFLIKYEPKD